MNSRRMDFAGTTLSSSQEGTSSNIAATRFALSQEPVVAGIPPSFFDLTEKAIEAGRSYRPITEAETEKLRQLAEQRLSVFEKQQERAYAAAPWVDPIYPDSPHECCPCGFA